MKRIERRPYLWRDIGRTRTLGLEPTSWFLLAIIAFVAAIVPFVEMTIAWYLKTRQ